MYIMDEAGRILAPVPRTAYERPAGPWDRNGGAAVPAVLVSICAWCPGFDATAPINRIATHGICPSCAVKFSERR